MLNLESRTEILGITVFQDADKEHQFYYLPGPPHITYKGGEPMFDLFSYRKGGDAAKIRSGGFLNMGVDLGIGSLKNRIENQLKDQYGDGVNLAPVPISRGSVRVIGLGEDSQALQGGVENEKAPNGSPLVTAGPRFIERILGSGKPSLYGDNNAIFSFSLSEDGTAFFLQLLNGNVDAKPLGVIYDLDYIGLLPAYDLEISIDFKSCYDYARQRFTAGTLFFKADIDNIVEELKTRQAIRIKEVSRTLELSNPAAVRERQSRIDQLVKDLATGALFQPTLTPGEPKVKGDTITAQDPTTTVSTPPDTSIYRAALAKGPTPAVAAGQSEAYGRSANPEDKGMQQSETATPSNTTTPASTPESGPTSATAADVWNSLGRPQAAFVMKNVRQEEQRTVTYNLTQVTAQQQNIAPQSLIQFLASPGELIGHVHSVDLNDPFFQRLNVNVNARDVDFNAEGITQMTVQLRYGTRPNGTGPKDTAELILRSKDDSADFTFFTDKKLAQRYEYKLIIDYRDHFGMGYRVPRVEGDWTWTEDRSLSVHPAWLACMLPVTVQLAPNMPGDVAEALARVRYACPAKGVDDSVLLQLNPGKRAQEVNIRLADGVEQYAVATKLFYTDGTSEDLPAITMPDPSSGSTLRTFVINPPKANRISGDVLMQDPLAEIQSVMVDTELKQGNNTLYSHSYELTAAKPRDTWFVRLAPDTPTPTLRYHERRFYRDSGLEDIAWREANTPNIVVGIPAQRVMSVSIHYIGPRLSDLGVNTLLLDLAYSDPGGDPGYEQGTSLLISDEPGTHVQEWKIRLPEVQARDYRWKLTIYAANGSETDTGYARTNKEQLIIRVPQL